VTNQIDVIRFGYGVRKGKVGAGAGAPGGGLRVLRKGFLTPEDAKDTEKDYGKERNNPE
jgi:hypothetical protein